MEKLPGLPPHARRTDPRRPRGRLPLVQIQLEDQVPEDAVVDAPAPRVLVEDADADDGPGAGEPNSNAEPDSDSEPDSNADSDSDSDSEPGSDSDSDADSTAGPEPDANTNPEPDADADAIAKCWGIGAQGDGLAVEQAVRFYFAALTSRDTPSRWSASRATTATDWR